MRTHSKTAEAAEPSHPFGRVSHQAMPMMHRHHGQDVQLFAHYINAMASGYDLSSGATRRYPLLETFDCSCRDMKASAISSIISVMPYGGFQFG
jgi:hypothetical protein